MEKLDRGQRHILNLIRKDQNEEGWAKVSRILLTHLKETMPTELVTFEGPSEDGGGRAQLTEKGNSLLDLQGYF